MHRHLQSLLVTEVAILFFDRTEVGLFFGGRLETHRRRLVLLFLDLSVERVPEPPHARPCISVSAMKRTVQLP